MPFWVVKCRLSFHTKPVLLIGYHCIMHASTIYRFPSVIYRTSLASFAPFHGIFNYVANGSDGCLKYLCLTKLVQMVQKWLFLYPCSKWFRTVWKAKLVNSNQLADDYLHWVIAMGDPVCSHIISSKLLFFKEKLHDTTRGGTSLSVTVPPECWHLYWHCFHQNEVIFCN